MCTLLVRFTPGGAWPVLIGAVRDEFLDRAWDPPARHWPESANLLGGRDRLQGGTWLALDPATGQFGAVLNGTQLPLPRGSVRPSRGGLPLAVANGIDVPESELRQFDGVHLVRANRLGVSVTTWDGSVVTSQALTPGDHVLVNAGVNNPSDPLVPFIAPLLAAATTPSPQAGQPTKAAWGDWVSLLGGHGVDPADSRALIVRQRHDGRVYGSSSATLIGIGADGVRYDFTSSPGPDAVWTEVDTAPAGMAASP